MTETDLRIKMAEAKGYTIDHDAEGAVWISPDGDISSGPPPLDHWCWGCVVELAKHGAYLRDEDDSVMVVRSLGAKHLEIMTVDSDPAVAVCTAWLTMKGLA